METTTIEAAAASVEAGSNTRNIRVLFSETQIATRITELAADIVATMAREPVIISVLKGGFIFTADLIRALHRTGLEPEIDFLKLSSYGERTESGGEPEILFDLSANVVDREVLIVDDILDTGRTLLFARNLLSDRKTRTVKACCLLDKAERRVVDVEAEFVGFTCPNEFVVGYGLDFAHRYRELPYIGVVSEP